MSPLTRVATIASTGVLALLLASSATHAAVASAQDIAEPRMNEMTLAQSAPVAEPAQSGVESAAPAMPAAAGDERENPEGPAYPPSPMQTAGAIGGALLAIVLAIVGVTVTFRMMREEMRRGRGRSRRSAAMTPQS
jgi:hypothetical protein